jgi:hypothetical protein
MHLRKLNKNSGDFEGELVVHAVERKIRQPFSAGGFVFARNNFASVSSD